MIHGGNGAHANLSYFMHLCVSMRKDIILPVLLLATVSAYAQPLTKEAAQGLADNAVQSEKERYLPLAQQQWTQKEIVHGSGAVMRFGYQVFGDKPADGRSLYISLHGGGNTSAEANDQQWRNQLGLYTPSEGVYVAPRAPTNTWMLWHEDFIDDLFDELIKTAVVMADVNPDKVYLLGYSAGGDGVYQLAPRMADRWAAASMMAGHPNDARAENLRNLPFALFMGGRDAAYNRNGVAAQWKGMLDSLQQGDPEGYTHLVNIFPEHGHWMERADTVAIDWMAQYRRNTHPRKVVWIQDDRPHDRLYWLGIPDEERAGAKGKKLVVSIAGQTVQILENDYSAFYIYLNDDLLDLDQPITVLYMGTQVMQGRFYRDELIIEQTAARLANGMIASVRLNLSSGG